MIEADQIESITAADVRSSDDEKVGSVGQIFLDVESGRPEWAAVRTGFFGTKEAFVPLRNAEWDGRVVRVAYDKERVRNAPHVDPDNRGLDPAQQVELYTYYGFTETTNQPPSTSSGGSSTPSRVTDDRPTSMGTTTSSEPVTDVPTSTEASSLAAGAAPTTVPAAVPPAESLSAVALSAIASRDDDGSETEATAESHVESDAESDTDDGDDAYVTRSEERLDVAVTPVATERVRLSKHVVTEQQTVTVTVRREELRIERVPIAAEEARTLGSGDGIGESETEIILYEEHPVVTTVLRPVERIRMTREVVSDERTVTGDVRKERVEVDGGAIG